MQVYVSAPAGNLEKSYQEIAAYKKTKLLAPGESQELSVSFLVETMASYCEKCNILRVLGQSSSYEGAKPYGEQFSLERFVW